MARTGQALLSLAYDSGNFSASRHQFAWLAAAATPGSTGGTVGRRAGGPVGRWAGGPVGRRTGRGLRVAGCGLENLELELVLVLVVLPLALELVLIGDGADLVLRPLARAAPWYLPATRLPAYPLRLPLVKSRQSAEACWQIAWTFDVDMAYYEGGVGK